MALYRVAQEGMTNIRRHANATQASIDVQCGRSSAHLVITDNGSGVPPGAEGFGLRGMRERVELIGGSVALEANPGGGTRLAIVIPQRALA
jgi:signal transduction histidine kinase